MEGRNEQGDFAHNSKVFMLNKSAKLTQNTPVVFVVN